MRRSSGGRAGRLPAHGRIGRGPLGCLRHWPWLSLLLCAACTGTPATPGRRPTPAPAPVLTPIPIPAPPPAPGPGPTYTVRTGVHPRVLVDADRVAILKAAAARPVPLEGTAFPQDAGTLAFDLDPALRTDPTQAVDLGLFDDWASTRDHLFIRHSDEVVAATGKTYCGTDPTVTPCFQVALQAIAPSPYVAGTSFALTAGQWHTLRLSWDTAAHSATLTIDGGTPRDLHWAKDAAGAPVDWHPDGQRFTLRGRDRIDNLELYDGADPATAHLVVSYPMNAGSGTVVSDASGHGYDGLIGFGVRWAERRPGDPSDQVLVMDGRTGMLRVVAGAALTEAWEDFLDVANIVVQALNTGKLRVDVSSDHPNAIENQARLLGLAYLVTGDPRFVSAAKTYAEMLLAVPPDAGGDYTEAGRVEAMGLLYDWFFEAMGAPDAARGVSYRDALAAGIAATIRVEQNFVCGPSNPLTADWHCTEAAHPDVVGGHSHQNNTEITAGLLAIIDEHPELKPVLDTEYRNFVDGYNPARAWISVDGGHHMGFAYGSTYTFIDSIQMWDVATTDVSMLAPWQGKLIDRYIWGLRGDDTYPHSGDAFKVTAQSGEVVAFALFAADHFGSTRAARFYDRWMLPSLTGGRFSELLYLEPNQPATPLSDLPESHLFRHAGQVLMRDGWDYPSATLLSFKSTSFWSVDHHHLDQNAFTLFYKAPLLLDSGHYDKYGTVHWHNYYTRTIAHDTVTVFDPQETFVRHLKSGQACCSNDGGQKFMTKANPQLADIEPGGSNHLDGVTAFEDHPGITFVEGNASKAYAASKIDQAHGFIRDLVFLRHLDFWPHPVVVVFDKVVSAPGAEDLVKRFLLHTESEPEPVGGTEVRPGHYRVSGHALTVRHGAGAVFVESLLPKDAVITKVGGKTAAGDYRFLVPVADATGTYHDQNFPPIPDPGAADPDEGAWRVEIRPATPTARTYFLEAMAVADNRPSVTPPKMVDLPAEGAAVALLGGKEAVAFNEGDTPATRLAWGSPVAGARVVAVGLVPGGRYAGDVVADPGGVQPYQVILQETPAGPLQASSQGLLVAGDGLPVGLDLSLTGSEVPGAVALAAHRDLGAHGAQPRAGNRDRGVGEGKSWARGSRSRARPPARASARAPRGSPARWGRFPQGARRRCGSR